MLWVVKLEIRIENCLVEVKHSFWKKITHFYVFRADSTQNSFFLQSRQFIFNRIQNLIRFSNMVVVSQIGGFSCN